ncbi:YVTN family beta-propeller repeat protein [Sphaerisporangium perillae]|uniref:YVTN family beta-propeller repeat protein n=1 Tax=Sphaerisporangium perillae TaxID=2935860 RepID=UPI00200DD3EE|nr:SMP-30/gluconolactonase/LRE family protein [Sphaerisporangium perillae]
MRGSSREAGPLILAGSALVLAATVSACSPEPPRPAGGAVPSGRASSPAPAETGPPAHGGAKRVATRDVYAHDRPGMLSPAVAGFPSLVYVPNSESGTVTIIDPKTYRVVRHFTVGRRPQHVVPSWDLKTLWVNNNDGNTLTPIDPATGKPGRAIPVEDPYNLYFTPDGTTALVMAERLNRLDFRDPQTFKLRDSLDMPCRGINHADFTVDGSTFLASCEFSGHLVVVDLGARKVREVVRLSHHSMPQDVKLSPDGRTFYVADMAKGGVWLVDAGRFGVKRFVRTGAGAHGLYVSRDSKKMYVSNRGAGSVSVFSFAEQRPVETWHIPGGGSPDMGGVSADGRHLWLAGRYHRVVYVFDTREGRLVRKIPVDAGPHGLAVYPQPGLHSLGHTGVFR